MTIITQDGRRLKVTKKDGVKFEAGTYVGYNKTYYVLAKMRTHRKGFIRDIRVCLGEYPDALETAEHEKEILERALESGKKFIHMGTSLAPKDDLMQSLKVIDDFYTREAKLGYCAELGMINGETNQSDGFNPDSSGSYAKALAKLQIAESESA